MKYFTWGLGLLASVFLVLYVTLFTSIGNGLLRPIIENKISQQIKMNSKLDVFSLSIDKVEVILSLSTDNTLHIIGNYSLFSQSFDLTYDVSFNNLNNLQQLSSKELNGSFYTDGMIKGDMNFMKIDGKSNIANSDTVYHVELTELNPTSIISKVKNAKLESLLYTLGEKKYANAKINLDINFRNIIPNELDGDIVLKTNNGIINSKLMKSDFNVTIPKTLFSMNLEADLKNTDIDYKYDLSSNLFKILSSGKIAPKPLKTDVKYSLNIKELAVLKPITNADIRGSFNLEGTAKGTKEKMDILGNSDISSSDTKFSLVLKEFKPSSLTASVKNLKLQKLLYMLKQPHYTDGVFSLNADIDDLKTNNLKGIVRTSITKGLLDSKYISKAYDFKSKMPRTTFNSKTKTVLNSTILDTKINVSSNIASFDIDSIKFNTKDNSLKGAYVAKVPNLDKLFFVTGQHLRGSMIANGELKKAKDMDLSFHTKIAKGRIDANLHNNELKADLKEIKTLGLLHILMYPEIFKASLDAKLNYNLLSSKGNVSGDLVNGIFARNQIFSLIKQYIKFDMYKEKFNGKVDAKINKDNIIASLDLRSRKASITTKDTKLNIKTKIIDSKVHVVANTNPVSAEIKGNINRPKVKVDVKDLAKKEINKVIKKEVGKLLKKFF